MMAGKLDRHSGEAIVNLRNRETEERISFRARVVAGKIETVTEADQRWIITTSEPSRAEQQI